MWSGNDDLIVNGHQKCVHVHINGNFENGKTLYMQPDWSLQELLNAASHRLDLVPTAVRIFSPDGVEIDDCMMIEDNDLLFFSTGNNFISLTNDNDTRGEDLPKSIGGYKVGSFLGKGGFGEVRVGEHQLTGERVAMKFISKRHFFNIDAAERTAIEIQCLNTLRHDNIIRFLQHLEAPAHVVLVFELMSGGDLYNYMRKKVGTAAQVALTEDEARHVFQQVLSAVGYAHNQHICHRDLKLENILLKGPTPQHVKIADFGLSDFYRPGALVKTSCGTLSFLAPEVFRGTSNAGPPVDVWALGVILFSLLCGRLPFEGSDVIGARRPREDVIRSRILKCQYKIDDGLSPEAKDLLRRMLRLDPSERASIPELFNHVWLRVSPTTVVDFSARERLYAIAQEEELANKAAEASLSTKMQLPALPMPVDVSDKVIRKASFDEPIDIERTTSVSPRLLPPPTAALTPRGLGAAVVPVDDTGNVTSSLKQSIKASWSSTSLVSLASEYDPDLLPTVVESTTWGNGGKNTMDTEEADCVLDDASVATNQKFRLVPLRRNASQPTETSPPSSRGNSSSTTDLSGYPLPLNIRAKQAISHSSILEESSMLSEFIQESQNAVRSQTARPRKTSETSESSRKIVTAELITPKGSKKISDTSFSTSQSPLIDRKHSSMSLAGAASLKSSSVKKKNGNEEEDLLLKALRHESSQPSTNASSHHSILPRKPQIPKQGRSLPVEATNINTERATSKSSIPRVDSMSSTRSNRG